MKASKKTMLSAAKIVLAVLLLGWVLNQVHWGDYVVDHKGQSFAVVETLADGQYLVTSSWPGRQQQVLPADDLQPVPGADQQQPRYVHLGFASTIRGLRVGWVAVAACGFGASLLIIALRWWLLLSIQRVRITAWESLRLTFLGQFFNAVVPGTVGGDVVKAWYVSKHTPRKAAVLISIFTDRLLGLAELTGMAAIMIAVAYFAGIADYAQIRLPLLTVAGVSAGVALAGLVLLSRRLRRFLRLQKMVERLWIARHTQALGEAANLYRRRIKYLLQAVIMTLGAHVAWVGSIAALGISLDLQVPLYSYFLYVPVIYILGAVPITPGGLGLVEKFYVVFFTGMAAGGGVSPTRLLALALLARLIPIFWGLPGAIVAVTGPKVPPRSAMAHDLGLDDQESGEGAGDDGRKGDDVARPEPACTGL